MMILQKFFKPFHLFLSNNSNIILFLFVFFKYFSNIGYIHSSLWLYSKIICEPFYLINQIYIIFFLSRFGSLSLWYGWNRILLLLFSHDFESIFFLYIRFGYIDYSMCIFSIIIEITLFLCSLIFQIIFVYIYIVIIQL